MTSRRIKCLLCAELQWQRVAASQALSENSLETDQWTVADTGLGMGGNPRGGGHLDSDSDEAQPHICLRNGQV